MKPVCVPCQRFYRPKKNGVRFVEGMPIENSAKSGRVEPEKWTPYKAWNGDLWECPDCGAQIISGVAGSPVAEHYQKDFALATRGSILQVNDC